jgi:hypothetical protein
LSACVFFKKSEKPRNRIINGNILKYKNVHFLGNKLKVRAQFIQIRSFEMFQTLIVASLAASAVAFRPAAFARPTLARVSMSAEGLAGESAPFGFFDPLSLSAGKTDGEVKVMIINISISV